MYFILNDLGGKIEYSKEELLTESLYFIYEAIFEKNYSLHELNVLYLCQEISGRIHINNFPNDEFPEEAKDIVEDILTKIQSIIK